MSDSLRVARTAYEALIARSAGGSLAATLIGGARVSARAVQASLRPGEVLLEYFVTAERLIVFVVTPSLLTTVSTGMRADSLAARVRFARALLGSRNQSGNAIAALRTLYGVLISPVAATGALGDARTLLIVPHSVLAYLPFAALMNPATERYLAESDREGTGYHTQRKAREQPDRWRSRLTAEQVDTVVAQLGEFPFGLVPS